MSGLIDKAKNYVSEKVAEMKKPEATVTDVDLNDVSRECITYNAKVSVSNPYSTSIPICEISYTLKSADRYVHFLFLLISNSINLLIINIMYFIHFFLLLMCLCVCVYIYTHVFSFIYICMNTYG